MSNDLPQRALPPGGTQSRNYSETTGQQVGGFCGGLYWIPESKFDAAAAQSRLDPRCLNDYRFEPFPCRHGR